MPTFAALFPLAKLFITPGARDVCMRPALSPLEMSVRHATGDWSEMGAMDQASNKDAIQDGSRVLSVYQVSDERFFAITEADRGSTTVLLAREY